MQIAMLLWQLIQIRCYIKTVSRLGVSRGAKLALACPGPNTNKQFGSLSTSAG